jgi:hydroxymethylpyrimidine kinase/phosphomethylpyrimidine kinase
MLASAETVLVVADMLRKYGRPLAVVDPVTIHLTEHHSSLSDDAQVTVSTSGHQLLPDEAVSVLREHVLPLATVLTPNLPEARHLLGKDELPGPRNVDDIVELAKELQKLGPEYVLVKGGHGLSRKSPNEEDTPMLIDVLYGSGKVTLIEKPFLESKNTHGTGCSLACENTRLTNLFRTFADSRKAAIACNLAFKQSVVEAVRNASHYVEAGIKTSINRGKGHGPINHFHSSYMLPFAPCVDFDSMHLYHINYL